MQKTLMMAATQAHKKSSVQGGFALQSLLKVTKWYHYINTVSAFRQYQFTDSMRFILMKFVANTGFLLTSHLSSCLGAQIKESRSPNGERLCWHYLSSHAVTRILLSAHMSLTSVFGMGTGGPSWQSTPTIFPFKEENNQ